MGWKTNLSFYGLVVIRWRFHFDWSCRKERHYLPKNAKSETCARNFTWFGGRNVKKLKLGKATPFVPLLFSVIFIIVSEAYLCVQNCSCHKDERCKDFCCFLGLFFLRERLCMGTWHCTPASLYWCIRINPPPDIHQVPSSTLFAMWKQPKGNVPVRKWCIWKDHFLSEYCRTSCLKSSLMSYITWWKAFTCREIWFSSGIIWVP